MAKLTPHPPDAPLSGWLTPTRAALLLAALAVGAYWNSLQVPLLFDDASAISENPTIRSLWPIWQPLSPPRDGSGVAGRPLVNLSLALNHAASGLSVGSYHATNLALHIFAAWALFGLVRRTCQQGPLQARFGRAATPVAFLSAGWWAVHPLQTESVTCIIQRTEILVGVFFLFTFYCLVRAATAPQPRIWHAAAVASCLCGMASKEVMVTAPVLLLLFDRTFLAGSWANVWQRRRTLHVAFAATWIVLLALVVSLGGTRGTVAGFGLGVPWWAYALKQSEAIIHYIRLSVWPHPLVLFYPAEVIFDPADVWWQIVLLLVLLFLAARELFRGSPTGFAAAWFFVILAPSSSIVPLISQTIAEHRMYLPLAAPVVLASATLVRLLGDRITVALVTLLPALMAVSAVRNRDYASEERIWRDTLQKTGRNPVAHVGLGTAFHKAGRIAEAKAEFIRALELDANQHLAMLNLAGIYLDANDPHAALALGRQALALDRGSALAHTTYGRALVETGQHEAGMQHLRKAIEIDAQSAHAYDGLARALVAQGQNTAAIPHLEEALRINPELASAHNNLGLALQSTDPQRALFHLRTATRLEPHLSQAHNNLGTLLAAQGDSDAAILAFAQAAKIAPTDPIVRFNLANSLLAAGRGADAVAQYTEALRLNPAFAEAYLNLGNALLASSRPADAIRMYENALRVRPGYTAAAENLNKARMAQQQGRPPTTP